MRLYSEFADWFHLLTAPADYAEEAAHYRAALLTACEGPAETLLELGSGGGNGASHLKQWFDCTLTDLSPQMLAISAALNPECEHVEGDMRSLRLERTFDLVFAHDAVDYMTTLDDLRALATTAFAHTRPGGAALFAPDCVRESFVPETDHGGHDGDDGRSLRYLEWTHDPDPEDTQYDVEMAYLMRHADGRVDVAHDHWTCGLFPQDEWHTVLSGAGFEVRDYPSFDPEGYPALRLFLCHRPS